MRVVCFGDIVILEDEYGKYIGKYYIQKQQMGEKEISIKEDGVVISKNIISNLSEHRFKYNR